MSQSTLTFDTTNENEISHEENVQLEDKVAELIDELGQLTESDIHDKIKDVIVDHYSE